MNLTGQTLDNKYLILGQIAEGGMSLVYQALNVANQTKAAVKLMKEKVTSSYLEDFLRFKREIEVISKFNHAGIVRAYGAGEYQNRPYLVTELLEGTSLVDLMRRTPGAGRIDEAVEIVTQIAQALQYVHQHGVIHRDLKPGNVFLLQGGPIHIKLMDFGIAYMVELGELKDEAEMVGTIGYMAPEASGILNRRIDERSDLYSLGVIFFHLLTGELPFKDKEIGRLLHSQVAMSPPRPSQINREIPRVLEMIILKLLEKDPDLRYQSAQGLLNDLEKYRHGEREFRAGARDQKLKLTYQTRLVGRELELQKLRAIIDQAVQGKGGLCFITGEAGIGKSRLVEEVRSYVYEQNGLFIRGRCFNHENKLPYQPFKDALDEYLREFQQLKKEALNQEIQRIKNITGDLGEILIRLNPRLEQLIGKPKPLAPIEPERENQRFLLVLADFFCRLANKGAVCVLALDDLQWVDEGSLNLLKEISAQIRESNLLILGTYRDNEPASKYGFERMLSRLAGKSLDLSGKDNDLLGRDSDLSAINSGIEEIKLATFPRESIQQLVALLLGATGENGAKLINFILERSGGNPFFAIHLVRELVESKALFWSGACWETDLQKLRKTPVPNNMVTMILKRINGLNQAQNSLLCRAAVIGREFELDLLYQIVAVNRETLVQLVDEMIAMQLLEKNSERGRLVFAHDRIRDAFYQKLTESERCKIHWEIARVIEATQRSNSEKVIFELTHHYLEAGEFARAQVDQTLEYILLAADQAKTIYANEEAVKYYQKGIEFLVQKGKKGGSGWLQASEKMIDVYLTSGKNDEAITVSTTIMPFIKQPLEQARIYRKLGNAYFKKGDWNQCEANLLQGLKILGVKMATTDEMIAVLSLKELVVYILRYPFMELRGAPRRTVIQENDNEIGANLSSLSFMYNLSGSKKFPYCAMRTLSFTEKKLPYTKELGMVYAGFAVSYMIIPWFAMALKYHQRALRIRHELGDEWGIAQSFQFIGQTYLWNGMYSKAIHAFGQSKNRFEKMGELWELGMIYGGLGFAYRYQSDYQTALGYFTKFLEISRLIDNSFGIMSAQIEILLCAIETNNYEKAASEIGALIRHGEETKQRLFYCSALTYAGILEIEQENYERATGYLEKAKKVDEENALIKNFSMMLYPYLGAAYIGKYKQQQAFLDKRSRQKMIQKIHFYCRDTLKKTRPWPNSHGIALRISAGFYALVNQNQRAHQLFLASIEYSGRLNQRYEMAKSCYEYGIFLKSMGRIKPAEEYWTIAAKTFNEIGAGAYLKKCDDLLGISDPAETFPEESTAKDRLTNERRMNTVLTTSQYISSILDLDELLEKILDSIIQLVGAERGVLLLYPETSPRRLEIKALRNLSSEEIWGETSALSWNMIAKVEKDKTSLIIKDALLDETFKNQFSVVLHGIRSVIAAPIMSKGEMLGVIYLDNHWLSGLFDEEDLQAVHLIANQAGVSIENARLYRRIKQYSSEIEQSRDEIAIWNQTLEQRVTERTGELEAANRELKAYASVAEELAVAKERNRIARDVHDTLGHTLSVLVPLLEASSGTCEDNPAQTRQALAEAVKITREGLSEVRRSVVGLVHEEEQTPNFVDSLEKMITNFQLSGMKVDFAVDESWPYLSRGQLETIYRVCQEALTNSLKHGQATEVHIILRFAGRRIKLFIFDNGCGCKDFGHSSGFGLRGMRGRVENLGGSIVFGSDGTTGFNIHVEIPIEGEVEER
ncbi:MAG TPA: protein kinase [Bacillota bacterium]|nr:protein kinase [Bacillota bacterium]